MTRPGYRWPTTECRHENVEHTTLEAWQWSKPHQVIRTRERCLDCGARHTPEGWQ